MALTEQGIQILKILQVYTQQFGVPQSQSDLNAIIGSIISVVGTFKGSIEEADRLIEEIATAFTPGAAEQKLVDTQLKLLADRAHTWLKDQESTVFKVVNAYVQRYAPQLSKDKLPGLVLTLIPMLTDWRLSKAEVASLVEKVVGKFDLQAAMGKQVGPRFVLLAQKVADYLTQASSVEEKLLQVVDAYLDTYQPQISESLIYKLVQGAIAKFSLGFGSATPRSLKAEEVDMLGRQIYLKVNLMEPSMPYKKTKKQLAEELKLEIDRFKQSRDKTLGNLDPTKPNALGELEVGIPIQPSEKNKK